MVGHAVSLSPPGSGLGVPSLGTVAAVLFVYAATLTASGIYRTAPQNLHLSEFLRAGLALCSAWVGAIALTYLLDPSQLPTRSVMVVHGLVALVGVLGLRALVRSGLEWWAPNDGPAPPAVPPPAVDLHDLVSRSPVQIDRTGLTHHLSDRTVLVTGAGGSVGAELSRQLLGLSPFRLGLVDVSEYNLYRLEQNLRLARFDGDIEMCIADVRDEAAMDRLFETLQPDVVLHTAAYKHVPLMERHPAEAFHNNTMATVHLLRLCEQHDVEQFVFVSTDKAVQPTSVLGATKRLAEWYVRAATSGVDRKIVRFGNVFGSQGSVVPRFEEQLAAGEPVTVTHPDMERFFMSVDEACGLILETLLLDTAPVYSFRMGDPIRIDDLARTLVQRWYPSVDADAMIEYVGRRPGEKLSETLVMSDETTHATRHDSIIGLRGSVPYSRAELEVYFRQLQQLSRSSGVSPAQLRTALQSTDLDAVPRDEPSSFDA